MTRRDCNRHSQVLVLDWMQPHETGSDGEHSHSYRLAPFESLAEQDRRYFRGVNSIFQNIPHPLVSRFDKHHACVNIGHCMKDMLARGTAVPF